jgi:hypothetical protein
MDPVACADCPRLAANLPMPCIGQFCGAYCGLAERGEREWIDRILAWCAPKPEVVVADGSTPAQAIVPRAAKPRVPLGTRHPKPGGG